MRIAVVYKSTTGFTERYARFIASELSAVLIPYKERKDADGYDILIFGGPVIAASVSGIPWFDKVKSRYGKAFLFATGASPCEDNEELNVFLSEQKQKGYDLFYMPGGLNYERMGKAEYFVMKKIFLPMVKKEKGEESEMYKVCSSSYSLYDEKYAIPLIEAVKAEMQ